MTFDELIELQKSEQAQGRTAPFRNLHLSYLQARDLLVDLRNRFPEWAKKPFDPSDLVGVRVAGWTLRGEAVAGQRSVCTCPNCRAYREERFSVLGKKLKEAGEAEREEGS